MKIYKTEKRKKLLVILSIFLLLLSPALVVVAGVYLWFRFHDWTIDFWVRGIDIYINGQRIISKNAGDTHIAVSK